MSPKSRDEEVEFLAAQLQKLEEMHVEFLGFVSRLKTKQVNGGELDTDGTSLIATCLSIRLTASHRPIARDRELTAIEYPFLTRHGERDLPIWRMFLEADYSLYADDKRALRICSFNNDYLANRLIEQIAPALLRSPIFAPSNQT
jgi:hypothetical protein